MQKQQLTKTEVDSVLQNLQTLQSQHELVVKKYTDLEGQNRFLWSEVANLRAQTQAQQWKINKVLAHRVT
jgi:hypothetical protein